VTGENVGTYAIQKGSLGAGANYVLTYVPADLTITAAGLTVTADAKSKAYGAVEPAYTWQVTGGALVGSDSVTGALSRVTGENVGAYAIQRGSVGAGANYVLTYVPADLTITAAGLTVTADAKSKVYGAAEPAFTWQVTGGTLVGSDSVTGTLTRVMGENVGTYAIQKGSLGASANYVLTYVPADLTISKKDLTVAADNQARVFGGANPPLTASYAGFANGESLANSGVTGSPSLTTTADVSSQPGDYTITVTLGTLAADNYFFNLSAGVLTVTEVGAPGAAGISGIEARGNHVSLTVHVESNEWCSIIAADGSAAGGWRVLNTITSALPNYVFTDTDAITTLSSRFYRVVIANAGVVSTNLTTYGVYVKPTVPGSWYKLSMPVDFGASNRMDSTLGEQLAHGLAGGDIMEGDLCYVLNTNGHWSTCLLDSNRNWVVSDGAHDLVPAEVEVEPWQSFWIKRRSAGSNTVSVFAGPVHTAPQKVTFQPGRWHMMAWPFSVPRREDANTVTGSTTNKGWGFAAAGAKRGAGFSVADQLCVGEGTSATFYYLNLDGRWCRAGYSTPASNLVFQAGQAYYYFHNGNGFEWTAKEE
jgi:hypothetical protein